MDLAKFLALLNSEKLYFSRVDKLSAFEFQGAGAGRDSGETQHAGASGGMTAAFRKAMELSAKRGKRIKMKYRNNPEKLAAWAVASHLDRAPKRSTPPAPATP